MDPTTPPPPPPPAGDHGLLPTYEAAISRDPIALIAPYVRHSDIFAASLVCRAWQASFLDVLWECPHLLWEVGDRPVLTKFLLFLRTLSTTPTTRPQTHTLTLTALRPTIYTTLPPKWLSLLLLRLPHLHTLTIATFPFFDHSSLLLLSAPHPLSVLHATNNTNTTPPSLLHLLTLLPGLTHLDLSATSGAAHPGTLSQISALRSLRSLSLRGLHIDDATLAPLLRALGAQLTSLDVGSNTLTDATADLLLDYSFAPPDYFSPTATSTVPLAPSPPPHISAASPPSPGSGLTRLRIGGNRLSSAGIQNLLKSTRLTHLDAGALAGSVDGVAAALSVYAWKTLQTLRIDHRVLLQQDGLRLQGLHELRTLVLCRVPCAAGGALVRALGGMLGMLVAPGCEVGVVEMEMEGDGGAYGGGDFSFFSGDPGEGEGGSSWAEGEAGGKRVDVVDVVRRWRAGAGGAWGGKVRVVRDLGGKGSVERGVGGERWGVVREGV